MSTITGSFFSALAGTGVVAVILGLWFKHYFGPYLTQKAKNLATYEDVQRLVEQVRETERVKADISDRVWDRQRRWDAKKEMYIDAYAVVHRLGKNLITLTQMKRAALKEELENIEMLEAALADVNKDLEQLGKVSFIAPLFLSDSASKSLWKISEVVSIYMDIISKDESLTDEDMKSVERDFGLRINPAIVEFAVQARKDIGYPSDESSVRS